MTTTPVFNQTVRRSWEDFLNGRGWDYHVPIRGRYQCKKPDMLLNIAKDLFNKDKNITELFIACERDKGQTNYHAHILIKSSNKEETGTILRRRRKTFTMYIKPVVFEQDTVIYVCKHLDKPVSAYEYLNR